MKSQSCPKCQGEGGFDTWDRPARQGSMHFKTICNLCDGECEIEGIPKECKNCNGKGGFDCWDKPARQGSMHYKSACKRCKGKGYKIKMPEVVATPVSQTGIVMQTPYFTAQVGMAPTIQQTTTYQRQQQYAPASVVKQTTTYQQQQQYPPAPIVQQQTTTYQQQQYPSAPIVQQQTTTYQQQQYPSAPVVKQQTTTYQQQPKPQVHVHLKESSAASLLNGAANLLGAMDSASRKPSRRSMFGW